jgi:hypothetical protein
MGLGLVECFVGRPQQVLAIVAMFRIDGHTHGDSNGVEAGVIDFLGKAINLFTQPLCQIRYLFTTQIGTDQAELLSALTAEGVFLTDSALHLGGYLL